MSTTGPPIPAGHPDAEVDIDTALVRALLEAQHPDLAALPITHLGNGWDNAMYRLGSELIARIPRRQMGADLIRIEQEWLPRIAPRLPIPIPAPVRTGSPTTDYPWHWSLVPWFDGAPADLAPPDASEADALARFLLALHAPAPPDAPRSAVRGIPLAAREASTEERLARLRARTDLVTGDIERLWREGLEAPAATERRLMHGDLHSQNLLVEHGRISAVIDWGDFNGGDVATDLGDVWVIFRDPEARARFFEVYAPDEALLARAKGWGVLFAAVLLDSGLVNSPRHAAMGRAAFERLAADAGG